MSVQNEILPAAARFESLGDQRAAVSGPLVFATVGELLPEGSAAILSDEVSAIDFAGVDAGDSAGLALLIEWLSVARAHSRQLTYANIPSQLHQLAALSDVDGLIDGSTPPPKP